MASFYKRGDYQLEAKVRKAGFPQLARTFESKSDAMAWANLRPIDIARGEILAVGAGSMVLGGISPVPFW